MRARCTESLARGLVLALFTACHASDNPTFSAQAIVGGSPSDRSSVHALENDLSTGFCTATAIGPRMLVTAKHCVQRPGANAPDDPSHYKVLEGSRADQPSRTHTVTAIFTTPGIYTSQTREEDGTLFGIDVGLVVTEEPLPASPEPVRFRSYQNSLPGMFETIGYGLTEDGDTGERRVVDFVSTEAGSDRVFAGPVACIGDSGGPLFDLGDGALVGVTSYGEGACASGTTAFNTFAHLPALFGSAVPLAGGCLTNDHCDSDAQCETSTSDLGTCINGPDAAVDAGSDATPDSAHPDAAFADGSMRHRSPSLAGGSCASTQDRPDKIWFLFGLFVLARRRRSPVACSNP